MRADIGGGRCHDVGIIAINIGTDLPDRHRRHIAIAELMRKQKSQRRRQRRVLQQRGMEKAG